MLKKGSIVVLSLLLGLSSALPALAQSEAPTSDQIRLWIKQMQEQDPSPAKNSRPKREVEPAESGEVDQKISPAKRRRQKIRERRLKRQRERRQRRLERLRESRKQRRQQAQEVQQATPVRERPEVETSTRNQTRQQRQQSHQLRLGEGNRGIDDEFYRELGVLYTAGYGRIGDRLEYYSVSPQAQLQFQMIENFQPGIFRNIRINDDDSQQRGEEWVSISKRPDRALTIAQDVPGQALLDKLGFRVESAQSGVSNRTLSREMLNHIRTSSNLIRGGTSVLGQIENPELLIRSFGDDNAEFYTRQEVQQAMSQEMGTVGLRLKRVNQDLIIEAMTQDSSAFAEGLVVGDELLEIDGQSVASIGPRQAEEKLAGSEGSRVNVRLRRDGTAYSKRLTRKAYQNGFSTATSSGVNIIQLHHINSNTAKELGNYLAGLERSGAKKLVLDLRGSTGGSLISSLAVVDLFFREYTPTVEFVTDSKLYPFISQNKNPISEDILIAVVINEQTESGAEIIAALLQEERRALLVGTRSAGNNSTVDAFQLSDGSVFQLTSGTWRYGLGTKSVANTGLQPDVREDEFIPEDRRDDPRPALEDRALDAAVKILQDDLQRFPSSIR